MPQAKPRAIANEDDLIRIFEPMRYTQATPTPILTRQKAGWNGIFLGHFRVPANESPEVSSPLYPQVWWQPRGCVRVKKLIAYPVQS